MKWEKEARFRSGCLQGGLETRNWIDQDSRSCCDRRELHDKKMSGSNRTLTYDFIIIPDEQIMTNIRRYYIPKAPIFMSVVCYKRRQFLNSISDKEILLSVMREVKTEKLFSLLGYVILNDHFHWIISPDSFINFSQIIQSVKLRFVHRFKKNKGMETNINIWQRRFWDHVIRDREDLNIHLDYIHYNPVRHGYVRKPFDYMWSSFKTHVERGNYEQDWAAIREYEELSKMDLE